MKREILRRTTKQRNVILQELRQTKSHPTVNSLFRAVKRRIPAISFGTVYRNLNLLRDQGKIQELTCGKYSCRYDGDTHNHYHFLCIKCNKILDLETPVLNNLNEKVSKELGMAVKYHRIDFYGHCERCAELMRK